MKTIKKRINGLQMYSIQNRFAAYGVNFKKKYRLEIYVNVFGAKHPIKIYHGLYIEGFKDLFSFCSKLFAWTIVALIIGLITALILK